MPRASVSPVPVKVMALRKETNRLTKPISIYWGYRKGRSPEPCPELTPGKGQIVGTETEIMREGWRGRAIGATTPGKWQ